MLINVHHINNYDQIHIDPKSKSLVVLDIDETIFKFEDIDYKWWEDNYKKYADFGYDTNKSTEIICKEWIEYIESRRPIMLDQIKFNELLDTIKNTDSKLIFLTARTEDMKNLTIKQLSESGIHFNEITSEQAKTSSTVNLQDNSFILAETDIYFSKNKGLMLKNLLEQTYTEFKNIIFVDDLERNISDVKKNMLDIHSKYKIDLYQLKHINL